LGRTEERLASFDEMDVWFMMPGEQLAVEVKSIISNEPDIRRGIFQCVKYRAVLEAQATENKVESRIRVRLVSETRFSAKLQRLAQLLDVELQIIQPVTTH